jgi:hypothetical protein
MFPLADSRNAISLVLGGAGQALGLAGKGALKLLQSTTLSFSDALTHFLFQFGGMLEAGFLEIGQGSARAPRQPQRD